MTEPIWVGMRLRPLVNHEIGQEKCLTIEGNQVSIVEDVIDTDRKAAVPNDFDRKSTFAFDVAMDSTDESSPSFVSQEKCYEIMGRRMVDHMLQGFNTCLFCYGQTGTGKTTTIMGKAQPKSERGLLMRLVDDVFEEVDKEQSNSGSQVHVVMQMLEVYNEKLKDLLATSDFQPAGPGRSAAKKINIHVHPELGVYLTGAIEAPVKTAAECIKTIEYGNAMKAVQATAMNAQSSRGHTVFKLNMVREGGSDNLSTTSEVCFADLAGRENEKTTQVTGERFVELSFINKSLLYLSGCIQSLGHQPHRRRLQTDHGSGTPKSKGVDMSRFRNSKLTLLLSNALSGNSRTSMIGTLSPAAAHFEESHNTLRFASTVKTIKVQAKAARAVDKDSLVKQLQLEVQQLKLQLEQAQEKHDDEDIREINVQLEATTAIVARQTRDWMVFQQESAELSRKRTKTMESLMAHSLGDCPPPYLANYSEDPHLAFRLVMPVAADGEEHSLGSGASCSFRLPPSLGVCDITGYIRNEEGRLWLRPEPLPRASTRPASIEVNGEKLSLEPLELQHLDCVLFDRSTIFYVFLQKVSPEELTAKLRSPYDIDKEEWEGGLTQKVVNSILGEARTDDPLERELARVYCNQLQSQNRDTQGTFMLRAFLQRAKRARLKVDEANDLTACIRPKSGLHFELVSQAPVLSYGFATHGNLPELSVRLVQRIAPLHRFRRAAWKLMAATKGTRIKDAVERVLPSSASPASYDGTPELLSTWTWTKFLSRLEMMHEVRQTWLADPDGFMLDPAKDPWAEHGPSEIQQLEEDHATRIQELRERAHHREEEVREAVTAKEAAQAELRRCKEELEAARIELTRQRSEDLPKPAVEAKADCLRRSLMASGGLRKALDATDAEGRVSRCLELARANKALLERLCLEQRESLLDPSELHSDLGGEIRAKRV